MDRRAFGRTQLWGGEMTELVRLTDITKVYQGGVTVAGSDLASMGETALARFRRDRIGFVFQFFHLLPNLTVLENVLIPAQLRSRESAEAPGRKLLAELGIEDLADRYPGQAERRAAAARGDRSRA